MEGGCRLACAAFEVLDRDPHRAGNPGRSARAGSKEIHERMRMVQGHAVLTTRRRSRFVVASEALQVSLPLPLATPNEFDDFVGAHGWKNPRLLRECRKGLRLFDLLLDLFAPKRDLINVGGESCHGNLNWLGFGS